ncbi:lipoyl protein ligase domain-containing protein [Nitratiruptor sp. SB155-2]|uniref:lipoyl protein ligase domain-containing protein n=1 Tax=Nitratiruptor sp. (strain SB155-2) TaxID=387092 RepID=UPI0001587174|nr:lipoate--protein ligase B [Nitratiruptor sp. SB155-2]BAF70037.1 lipoate-protein ligase B [Nitratiruptor sp. SB155-2]
MKIVDLGLLPYEKCNEVLEDFIQKAQYEDHLLLCTHHPVYTIGSENYETDLPVIRTDRGGSITYFDEGCLMLYFAFRVPNPPKFYAKVLCSLDYFFHFFDKNIQYDKKKPGYYIQNRKIASLGFRYTGGFSKHGVSLHVDPHLENFNKIAPCGLSGIKATSLINEGYNVNMETAKTLAIKAVEYGFKA